jgi:translation initiation factor 4G
MQQNQPTVVGGPTIVDGNPLSDHSRKPSVTISAAGATGYMPNGGPTGRPNNLHFGSIDAQGTPPMQNPEIVQNQHNLNPSRISAPDADPSPIPQQIVSGGRPPSSLQGQGNNLSFGPPAENQNDMNVRHSLSLALYL